MNSLRTNGFSIESLFKAAPPAAGTAGQKIAGRKKGCAMHKFRPDDKNTATRPQARFFRVFLACQPQDVPPPHPQKKKDIYIYTISMNVYG